MFFVFFNQFEIRKHKLDQPLSISAEMAALGTQILANELGL